MRRIPAWAEDFFRNLRRAGLREDGRLQVAVAAELCAKSQSYVYRLRELCPEFRQKWDETELLIRAQARKREQRLRLRRMAVREEMAEV